ncbi:MAG TPA: NADH-quinone oxidoreductase subunit N [Thermoleophilia bacterium]|nr:NADH-quinone oxidoreductase subunit N [Thermoleophilia bacterium]
MPLNNTVTVILPGVVVALAAVVVFVADLFLKRKDALAWIAVAGLLCGAAVAIGQWGQWTAHFAVWRVFTGGLKFGRREPVVGFAGMIGHDHFSIYAVVLFCAVGVLAVMLADAYLARRRAARGEFYGLLLLIITGMIGMAVSTDIIAFFVSFELMSLPTYVLAGYIWRDERSSEASLKYFVTGAFSSAILAFGLALLYAATGATSYAGIAAGLNGLTGDAAAGGFLVVAFVLVVTGFGFKVSAVPFHSWAPDVYEGAPTPVTAFMATAVKAAAFIGFAKLFIMAAGSAWSDWGHVMIVLAILTMVIGNVLALPQRNLKRMLAYSSIAHAGYLTLGLIAAGKSGDRLGVSAVLFYLAAYALMNLGAFGVLIWIRSRRAYDYSLDGIAGMGRSMPWPAFLMALFMISLTGIPPTVGFWGKFYLFTAVVQAHLTWLAIIAVVMSAVSAYYYLRVVWYLYFREAPEGEEAEAEPASTQAGVITAVTIAALGVALVGLFPGPLLDAAQGALRVLIGG